MKRNIVTILLAAVLLTGCGKAATTEEAVTEEPTTEEAATEEAATEEPAVEEPTIEEPTTEEAEPITDYSEYLSRRDCYGFLLSSYEDVRDVNLGEVFYSGAGVSVEPDEEEIQAYLQETGQEELYTDLFCVPAESVDQVLLEKTGYSLQEMQEAGNDLDMLYIEAYDAYFQEVGDTNYIQITCTNETDNGDGTITLECTSSMGEEEEDPMAHKCTVTLDKETGRFISNEVTNGYYMDIYNISE